jgi:thiol:disulfide interchange protein DsbD
MKMKKALTTLVLLLAVMTVAAQMQDPVHVRSELKKISDTEGELLFSATIDPGWHVYSTGLGDDGPISATFHADKLEGAKTVGGLKFRGKELKMFDKMFDMELRYFEGSVTFVQKIQFTQPKYDIKCYVEYGACNDQMCMPPSTVDFDYTGKGPEKAPEAATPVKEEPKAEKAENADSPAPVEEVSQPLPVAEVEQDADTTAATMVLADSMAVNSSNKWWQPCVDELKALNGGDITDRPWLYIFLMGLLYGLLAVFTPCV